MHFREMLSQNIIGKKMVRVEPMIVYFRSSQRPWVDPQHQELLKS